MANPNPTKKKSSVPAQAKKPGDKAAADGGGLESQLRKLILTLGRERTQEILNELASIGL